MPLCFPRIAEEINQQSSSSKRPPKRWSYPIKSHKLSFTPMAVYALLPGWEPTQSNRDKQASKLPIETPARVVRVTIFNGGQQWHARHSHVAAAACRGSYRACRAFMMLCVSAWRPPRGRTMKTMQKSPRARARRGDPRLACAPSRERRAACLTWACPCGQGQRQARSRHPPAGHRAAPSPYAPRTPGANARRHASWWPDTDVDDDSGRRGATRYALQIESRPFP